MSLAEQLVNQFKDCLTEDEINKIMEYKDNDSKCKEVAFSILADYIPESYRKEFHSYGTTKEDCVQDIFKFVP